MFEEAGFPTKIEALKKSKTEKEEVTEGQERFIFYVTRRRTIQRASIKENLVYFPGTERFVITNICKYTYSMIINFIFEIVRKRFIRLT